MERKILIIVSFALLALVGFVIARNDLTVGSLQPGSVLLYQQTYNRTGVAGQMQSQDVFYTNPLRNITRIRALDLNANGTGGFASIVSGGVGFRNVTIRLQSSAIGRGFTFFVDIYGN
ncbi:CLUMA_CG014341, isoform A [Clunio marinus]|uniref:CLUMA_CG014341, isoform A n=1 Tax=Clunio marinus TaxID=568069 RepID=A0A1J1IMJ1_9DIPT|nr:CLUMA_CG014341, isoform A [Clunio marinus]